MQTFVPFPSLHASVAVLDAARLGKQRVEAFQLLVTLGDSWALSERRWRIAQGLMKDKPLSRKGWSNHPAAKMWASNLTGLRAYYNQTIHEWELRGKNNTMRRAEDADPRNLPDWFGREPIHSSHRSRLLFKGSIDLLAKRIRQIDGVRGAAGWLKSRGFPEMNALTIQDRERIHSLLDNMHVPRIEDPNWYDQFHWNEDDRQGYIWPN